MLKINPLLMLGLLSGLSSFAASAAPMNIDCVLRGSCINTQNTLLHLQALQGIADSNKGTRAAGTTGHELSANYVA
jgi:hypothetical protein